MGINTRMRMGLRACIWSGWICSSPSWPFMRNACNVHREPCMCRGEGGGWEGGWLSATPCLVHKVYKNICIVDRRQYTESYLCFMHSAQVCTSTYSLSSQTLHSSGGRKMVWLDRLEGIPLSRCSSHLPMCHVQWVTLYVTSKPTYIVWSIPDITHST